MIRPKQKYSKLTDHTDMNGSNCPETPIDCPNFNEA